MANATRHLDALKDGCAQRQRIFDLRSSCRRELWVEAKRAGRWTAAPERITNACGLVRQDRDGGGVSYESIS